MSWFFETREIPSEKNRSIFATQRFGSWRVTVDDIEQTGPEVHEFWDYALNVVAVYQGVQRISKILMLGLGAGGEVKNLNRKFRRPRITAIEYDSEMVMLARSLKLHSPFLFPTVICKDAALAVPQLSGTFDLIVSDMFNGEEPSPLAKDAEFLSSLDSKLERGGFLLVNVFKDETLLADYEKKFLLLKKWRFNLNHFGLFQKREVLEAMNDGYLPVRQWPELNALDTMPKFSTPSRVGKNEEGVYWQLWPFSFENYLQDNEPDIIDLPKEKQKPFRIIMWQRRLRFRPLNRWWAFSDSPFLKVGFVPLGNPAYAKNWSETAQRELKRWNALKGEGRYSIRTISYEEFAKGYMKSTLPMLLRQSMLFEVKVRLKNPKAPVHFFGVERASDGKIVAGVSVMESPSLKISYYLAGFFTKDAQHDPVMTGLFDFWFQDGIARGLKFIDFGNFWKPGDESSWKGFSMFKAKFNPLYFFYPAKLYKFRWGK